MHTSPRAKRCWPKLPTVRVRETTATAAAAASVAPQQAMETLIRGYLSQAHQEATETGCPIAALVSEMPRQSPEVRRAATRHIKGAIDLIAQQSADYLLCDV
jgi:hypothetical protein